MKTISTSNTMNAQLLSRTAALLLGNDADAQHRPEPLDVAAWTPPAICVTVAQEASPSFERILLGSTLGTAVGTAVGTYSGTGGQVSPWIAGAASVVGVGLGLGAGILVGEGGLHRRSHGRSDRDHRARHDCLGTDAISGAAGALFPLIDLHEH